MPNFCLELSLGLEFKVVISERSSRLLRLASLTVSPAFSVPKTVISSVAGDELGTLHEHAAGASGGDEYLPVVRFQYLDDQLDDAGGGAEHAAGTDMAAENRKRVT